MTTKKYDCYRCYDEAWVCESHSSKAWSGGADGTKPTCHCGAPGMPCPTCNKTNPPRFPLGAVVAVALVDGVNYSHGQTIIKDDKIYIANNGKFH